MLTTNFLFIDLEPIDPGKEDLKDILEENANNNRESPNCNPDSTTSPSPSALSSVTTACNSSTPTMTSSGSGMGSTGTTPSVPQVTTAHALALLPTLYSAYAAGATPTSTVTPSGIFSYIAAGLMPPSGIGGTSLSPGGVVPTLTQPRPPPSHPFHISNLTSTDSVKRPVAHLALPPGAGGESNIPI